MATDFFGFTKTVASDSKDIATAEALILSAPLGSELLQSVALQYSQSVRPIFAIGNSNVHFVGGQSTGSLNFQRMSACGDIFAGLSGLACGVLSSVSLSGGGAGDCFCAPGGLTITNAYLQSVSLNATAGRTEILEGGNIVFAMLSK